MVIPSSFDEKGYERGSHSPYLGSHTSESTSLIQAWEKDTNLPTIRRAANLRNAINWFVAPDSHLAKSILNNLESLTGESADVVLAGFERTGSARHRYACSRVSNGGFLAQSPFFATQMTISTDPLNKSLESDENYDFMYQSCLVFAQGLAGLLYRIRPAPSRFHFHLSCRSCLRKISDLHLESDYEFKFPSAAEDLADWKPSGTEWLKTNPGLVIPTGPWNALDDREKSYHIGIAQGFMFGDWYNQTENQKKLDDLFPYTINSKVIPQQYLQGIATGLLRAASLSLIHRLSLCSSRQHWELITANYWARLDNLTRNDSFLKIISNHAIMAELMTVSHRISPSFPTNSRDLAVTITSYFRVLLDGMYISRKLYQPPYPNTWVFSDFATPETGGLLILSSSVTKTIMIKVLTKTTQDTVREMANLVGCLRSKAVFSGAPIPSTGDIYLCSSEVRHSCKGISNATMAIGQDLLADFTAEFQGGVTKLVVPTSTTPVAVPNLVVPRIQNPLISGLRTSQIATGSHMKLGCILKDLKIEITDAICGGDGSGGWGSRILREYRLSRVIFNSLMCFDHLQLNGVSPSPPSAIYHLGPSITDRCPNLTDAWENPSDLRDKETWQYFLELKRYHRLVVDLITLDMESIDSESDGQILDNLFQYMAKLMTPGGILIYKSYISKILSSNGTMLDRFLRRFNQVTFYQTDLSSSFTSEIYLVCEGLNFEARIDKYPEWIELTKFFKNCYVYRTIEEEFQRGLIVSRLNLSQGVPKTLAPKSYDELSSILIRLTVPHHHAILAGQIMSKAHLGHGASFSMYLLALIGLFGLKICTKEGYKPHLPSDQIVGQSVAVVVGINIWLSLTWKDISLFKACHDAIANNIPVYCHVKTEWLEKPRRRAYVMGWSFTKVSSEYKIVRLDSKMALIGAVVRLLHSHFPISTLPTDHQMIDEWLFTHKLGLGLRNLIERIGSFDFLG